MGKKLRNSPQRELNVETRENTRKHVVWGVRESKLLTGFTGAGKAKKRNLPKNGGIGRMVCHSRRESKDYNNQGREEGHRARMRHRESSCLTLFNYFSSLKSATKRLNH